MLRNALDRLYLYSGYVAAVFLVGIAIAIIAQIVGRMNAVTIDATEAAGLCLAAATFFGLAHTFRLGGHVRINIVLDRLPAKARRAAEIFNCLLAGCAITYLAWNVALLALQSREYNDVSPGFLAMPFWIPQAGVAAGVTVFAIAIWDELIAIMAGSKTEPAEDESRVAADRPVA